MVKTARGLKRYWSLIRGPVGDGITRPSFECLGVWRTEAEARAYCKAQKYPIGSGSFGGPWYYIEKLDAASVIAEQRRDQDAYRSDITAVEEYVHDLKVEGRWHA